MPPLPDVVGAAPLQVKSLTWLSHLQASEPQSMGHDQGCLLNVHDLVTGRAVHLQTYGIPLNIARHEEFQVHLKPQMLAGASSSTLPAGS